MTGYVLSPAAEADLDEIWDYTADYWSEEQADTYVRAIRNACQGLAGGKLVARSIEHTRPGYRKYPVGSHFLFLRLTDNGQIDIVRILHQRMDHASRLLSDR